MIRQARSVAASAVLLVASSWACGPAKTTPPAMPAVEVAQHAGAEVVARQGACQGRLSFPKEDAAFEQEIAVVEAGPGAFERADTMARRKLLERVCGSAQRCQELHKAIRPWKRFRDGNLVCVSMLIDQADVAAFEGQPLKARQAAERAFKSSLQARAEALAKALPSKGGKVVVDRVALDCVEGGHIASWLIHRLGVELQKLGLRLEVLDGVEDKGVQGGAVLSGRMVSIGDSGEFEIQWSLRRAQGTILLEPLRFASLLAPKAPSERGARCDGVRAVRSDEVNLFWDKPRQGGALCNYQSTMLSLYAKRGGHVRVFSLNDDASFAMMTYPDIKTVDARLRPGELRRLAEQPFMIVKTRPEQKSETYVVVVAEREGDLGAFATQREGCALSPAQREALRDGKLFDTSKVVVHSSTYRILDGPACNYLDTPKSRADRQVVLRYLNDSLPTCAAGEGP